MVQAQPAARVGADAPCRRVEQLMSEHRERVARSLPRRARRVERGAVLPDLRQHVLAVHGGPARETKRRATQQVDPRELPVVREVLDSIAEGGYAEAARPHRALLVAKAGHAARRSCELKTRARCATMPSTCRRCPADELRRVLRRAGRSSCEFEPERAKRDAAASSSRSAADRRRAPRAAWTTRRRRRPAPSFGRAMRAHAARRCGATRAASVLGRRAAAPRGSARSASAARA